jgi:hypothetical protein
MKTETNETRPGKAGKLVTAFKPASDIEARRAFREGSEAARAGDTWGVSDLKKLSREGLVERLVLVDNRSTLLRWRIFSALRAKFDNDRAYGQYLLDLKNDPEYAPLLGSQQDMNRCALAGAFCEKFSITDLSEAGVLKSTVYELSRPQNADVADKIYRAVKRKSVPLAEVRRMIEEAKSIPGEIAPEVQRIDYSKEEPVRHLRKEVQVERGVAQIPEVLSQKSEQLSDMLARAFSEAEAVETELKLADNEYLSKLGEKYKVAGIDEKAEELPEEEPERPELTVVWQRGMPDRRAATTEQDEIARLKNIISGLEGRLAASKYAHTDGDAPDLTQASYEELILEIATRTHDAASLTMPEAVNECAMLDERLGWSTTALIALHTAIIKSYQKLVELNKVG